MKSLAPLAAFALVSIGAQTAFAQTLLYDYQDGNYSTGTWANATSVPFTLPSGVTSSLTANPATPLSSTQSNGTADPTGGSGSPVVFNGSTTYPLELASPLSAPNFTTTSNFTLSSVISLSSSDTAGTYAILGTQGGGVTNGLNFLATLSSVSGGVGTLTFSMAENSGPLAGATSNSFSYTLGTPIVLTLTYQEGGGVEPSFFINQGGTNSTEGGGTFNNQNYGFQGIGNIIGANYIFVNNNGTPPFTKTAEASSFAGNIYDLQIYSGAMSSANVATLDSNLFNTYVTAPEPASWALMGVGLLVMLCLRRKLNRY